MIKFFLFFFLLFFSALFARENPFFPVEGSEALPVTSNLVEDVPPLERASLKLPSTARVLESITVEYKNLDGSIATKKIAVNNSIDWHLPLFITQDYTSERKQQYLKKKVNYTEIAALRFIKLYASEKRLKIVTKDKMLRNFLLVKPHRIVCDFQRDTDFGSYVKKLKKAMIFKKVSIGTHSGYYRVVIELDGHYQYTIKKSADGYIFKLL